MEQELLKLINRISTKKDYDLSNQTNLFSEHILNSMNILDLIGFVEKHLNRRLNNDEIIMSNFSSIKAIETKFFTDATK